jgi:hypothetical protein
MIHRFHHFSDSIINKVRPLKYQSQYVISYPLEILKSRKRGGRKLRIDFYVYPMNKGKVTVRKFKSYLGKMF